MVLRRIAILLAGLALVTGASFAWAQEDVPGAKDHPLITRMPGYYIVESNVEEFAAFDPTVIGGKEVHWEGKKFTIAYKRREGGGTVSWLQVVRNYEAAVKKAYGKILGGDERRVAAEIRKGGALTGVYVEAYNGGWDYTLTIVESQEMRQDVIADAAAMGKDIAAGGKTVIQGIFFDTGSAVIKPQSEAALTEMVKLMKGTPSLKAYIVGHTDNVGALDSNLKLSTSRADALVKALVARGIGAGRVKGSGVGPYSPIASNRGEPGRAQNRRVELVEQ